MNHEQMYKRITTHEKFLDVSYCNVVDADQHIHLNLSIATTLANIDPYGPDTFMGTIDFYDADDHLLFSTSDLDDVFSDVDDWFTEKTKELKRCKHKKSTMSMQNPKDNLNHWLYCTICGDWLERLV